MPQRTNTKPTPAPEFVKASAIAPRLGCTSNTVHKWHKAGLLPTVRVLKIGTRILFNRADVDALVAGGAVGVA